MTFVPKRLGDVPLGLSSHHREFLRRLKDAVEILMGAISAQDDTNDNPNSKAVTFGDAAAASSIIIAGNLVSEIPSSIISLAAGDTLTATHKKMVVVGNGGAVVLTSTPNIANGSFDGQLVTIEGTDDVNMVTFQDESALPGSGLKCQGGFNMKLGKGDSITFRWWDIDSLWKERSRADV